ncbi:hypothetical protein JIG36_44145 [Actinoplanes sp. LDG1-06]|uniref:Uncharacterized protein n=1 Tax=Paractinoplanes ovalisporus TaxID=2810368 RepID=A0ABS2ART5_9ACTN|nr:hypothetical protein [Actinoplanes ovalisporus]MBM2622516.1 hypothetical protein [Actinoplanes ovalisporus]
MSDTPRDREQDDDSPRRVLRSSASPADGSTPDDSGDDVDHGTAAADPSGTSSGSGSGWGWASGSGTRRDMSASSGPSANPGSGTRRDVGASSGPGANPHSGADLDIGVAPDSGSDLDTGAVPHSDSGSGGDFPESAGPGSPTGGAGSPAGDSVGVAGSPVGGSGRAGRRAMFGLGAPSGEPDERQRRRRRWWVAGISIGAAIVVIALCVGSLAVISAVSGVRDRADDAREARALRDQSCLDLERRLNRLTPPGSTTTPNARAAAIRNEDSALRIYLNEVTDERSQDAWRRILDSRTVYADILERLAKSPSAPFYLPPKNDSGVLLTDELVDWSPASCTGPIRRLAAPDL